MQNAKTWTCRTVLVCGGALTLTLIPVRAWSQQDPGAQYQNQQQNQYQNSNSGNGMQEGTANFDRFLDDHPTVEKDLVSNPSLCNDANYLSRHPDLQDFLNRNPQMRVEFQRNPNLVMQHQNRFEGGPADRDRATGQNPNPDLSEREVGRMDQFLDDHPKIEKELQKNPSRINDRGFLRHNRGLEAFLNNHPQIHEEFAENPSYFMQRENHFEGTPADRDQTGGRNPNPNVSERQVGRMDQFLDDHTDIKKDLDKNPSLISDNKYVQHHKDLDRLLSENRGLRTAFAENSAYFIRNENQFEGNAGDRDRMRPNPNTANTVPVNPNTEVSPEQVAKMDQFLDDHPDIKKQLDEKPGLISDNKYVQHHKDLDRLLSENRGLRTAFADNPSYFAHRENRFEGTATDRDAMRRDGDRNVADMHKFLEKHKRVAKDLDRDPGRANDHRYLERHKDLRSFFDQHQQCRTEFAENPRHFMEREHDFRLHNDHRLDNHQLDKDRNKNLEHRAKTDPRNQL